MRLKLSPKWKSSSDLFEIRTAWFDEHSRDKLLNDIHADVSQDQKMYGIEKIRKILMLFSAFTIVEYDGNAGDKGIPLSWA